MSYSQWLESIGSFTSTILGWIGSISDILLNNYIVVTILGFSLFTSLYFFILDIFDDLKEKKGTDFDNVK